MEATQVIQVLLTVVLALSTGGLGFVVNTLRGEIRELKEYDRGFDKRIGKLEQGQVRSDTTLDGIKERLDGIFHELRELRQRMER